ncbi:MAG TPA: hypothetical protein VK171_00135, partial [Fimbriimonas sp.]|nr:hypothetical protein [Fimbriimonas sp.]
AHGLPDIGVSPSQPINTRQRPTYEKTVKKWLNPLAMVVILGIVVAILWSFSPETARARALLTKPLWPASRGYLSGNGISLATLLKMRMRSDNENLQRNASDAIWSRGKAIVPAVLREIGSKDQDVSTGAYNFCTSDFDARAIEPLLETVLDTKHPNRRSAMNFVITTAANAKRGPNLAKRDLDRALRLITELGKVDPYCSNSTAMMLGYWDFDDGEFVKKLSQSQNVDDRVRAATACLKAIEAHRHDADAFTNTLADMYTDPDPAVQAVCAFHAQRNLFPSIRRGRVNQGLLQMTWSPDPVVRRRAFRGLQTQGFANLRPIRDRLLKDPNPDVRAVASR